MKKSIAIKLLGPSSDEAGKRIGCSGAAVRKWPDLLPPRLVDRVIAASVRASFERQPHGVMSGRIRLPPDLFAYLWREQLLARAEETRRLDAEARQRKITEHDAELDAANLAAKQRLRDHRHLG